MKQLTMFTMAIVLFSGVSLLTAEETKSGLQSGEHVGPFYVTKLCGADDDGVTAGKNLCYRCKNGGRPQVMVFTRSSDENVVKLVRQLDKAIPENDSKQLRAFVNVLGEDKTAGKSTAEKLAESSEAKNVPFVLPNEFENGPADYGINPKADVTIIMVNGGKVIANHAAGSAKDLNVQAVVDDLSKILN